MISSDSTKKERRCVPLRCTHVHVLVREVSQSVSIPVLIGSGVTYDNIECYMDANGMIIGSHFKEGGHWANAVDPERVKRFMGKIGDLRK